MTQHKDDRYPQASTTGRRSAKPPAEVLARLTELHTAEMTAEMNAERLEDADLSGKAQRELAAELRRQQREIERQHGLLTDDEDTLTPGTRVLIPTVAGPRSLPTYATVAGPDPDNIGHIIVRTDEPVMGEHVHSIEEADVEAWS